MLSPNAVQFSKNPQKNINNIQNCSQTFVTKFLCFLQDISSEIANLCILDNKDSNISYKYIENLIASIEALFKAWEKGIGSLMRDMKMIER